MKIAFLSIHVIVSLIFISLILIQTGKGGLGRTFGSDAVYRSKRGAEKAIFRLTFFLAVCFFLTSVANILVH